MKKNALAGVGVVILVAVLALVIRSLGTPSTSTLTETPDPLLSQTDTGQIDSDLVGDIVDQVQDAMNLTDEPNDLSNEVNTNLDSMDPKTPTHSMTFVTNKGDITLELFGNATPLTVEKITTYATEDFYDGTRFHRVIKDFMIQGGDPLSKDTSMMDRWGTGGPAEKFADEFVDGLSNARGTIAMANAGPGTNGSQFFINVVDNNFLDGKHTVFGQVTGGMDVADAIVASPTGVRDVPVDEIVIQDVVVEVL